MFGKSAGIAETFAVRLRRYGAKKDALARPRAMPNLFMEILAEDLLRAMVLTMSCMPDRMHPLY